MGSAESSQTSGALIFTRESNEEDTRKPERTEEKLARTVASSFFKPWSVSDTRVGVSSTHVGVSNTRLGVSNTRVGVSNTSMGVPDTREGVYRGVVGAHGGKLVLQVLVWGFGFRVLIDSWW